MRVVILTFIQIFLFIDISFAQDNNISSQISTKEVETHLRFLASDELAGREPGTYGAEVAARYIAEQFRQYGLKCFNDCRDYFQYAEYEIEKDRKRIHIKSENVIGYLEGTDPILKAEYVLLCAHYDHLGIEPNCSDEDIIYNGARDNGMGIVSLISAAKILSINSTLRSVLFAAFTGEEEGMCGSKYFVKHPPIRLNDVKFVLNSDGGGYNDTTLIRIAGLNKINVKEIILKTCTTHNLECLPYPEDLQYLYNLSDNATFAVVGIPAITVSPGFDKVDEDILKYIHTVEDEADNYFNYSYLQVFAEVYSAIALAIANTDHSLNWNHSHNIISF